jgi:Legionella pneumophila major outer membrane protein precursor
MKRYLTALAALAVALPAFAAGNSNQGQSMMVRPQAGPMTSVHTQPQPPQAVPMEAFPEGDSGNGGNMPGPGECDEGYGGEGCCESQCCPCGGCGNSCGGNSCGSGWSNWCNLCGGPGNPSPWFVTADYLYVRANVSEAPAYLDHNDTQAPVFTDTFHELDFQYQSSYRFGGGYKLPCCDEELRFMFTRMSSSADTTATGTTVNGPFETSPGPDGTFTAHGQVDTKSYDVEFAKTIPLGGCCNTGCGDSCSSCCHPSCPAWDITFEGGFRFAQVNWDRTYASDNPTLAQTRTVNATMNFQGGGPRFGMEGRRYFGQRQWFSAYLKGDISLLLGHVDVRDHRVTSEVDNPPDTVEDQFASFRNIIPVTEIETGLTGRLTSNTSLTAGYLFSAWHDLGFRDQFAFSTFLETNYDDANILGFDGFFARLEVDF